MSSLTRCIRLVTKTAFTIAVIGSTFTVALAEDRFTLTRYFPNDVMMYVGERQNPERSFTNEYWIDVFATLKASGIQDDVAEMIAEIVKPSDEQTAEIARLQERVSQLLAGVDWAQLNGAESAFAQRLSPSWHLSHEHPNVVMNSMVWIAPGSADGARANFKGLTDILRAIAEEANRALGAESLVVESSEFAGAEVARLNLLAAAPMAPPMPISVALRDNVILMALRDDLLRDVLELMDGTSTKSPLADDSRFQAGIAKLPPAEDSIVYFDMQATLKPLIELKHTVFHLMAQPGDNYLNTGKNAEASKINEKAMSAYQSGDYKKALQLTEEAYALAKDDSIILYNLACFNALVGNREKALKWLMQAVDAGFYAPGKIASDSDLKSLRDAPEYREALAVATEKARALSADDVISYAGRSGEVKRLCLQVCQAQEEKNLEHALQLNEQALAIDPKDPELLYSKASIHAMLGQQEQAFTSLKQAIDAGFYCPQRIREDATWKSWRDTEPYTTAVACAAELAGHHNLKAKIAKTVLVREVLDRAADAAGVIDYSATSKSTKGFATWTDSVTVLVPDAETRAIYPVIAGSARPVNVDRFLPAETDSFSISAGIRPSDVCKFIETTIAAGGPLGKEILAKWEKTQEDMGLNLRNDVFDLLTGTSIQMTLGSGQSTSTVTLIGVTDEKAAYEQINRALTELPQWIGKLASKQPAMAGLAALTVRTKPLEHEQLKGFQTLSTAMSPEPIAVWGVSNGFLIVGSSADAVAMSLAASKGEHPRFRDNAAAMKEALLPDGPFVSASLTNYRGDNEEMAMGMTTASLMSGMVTTGIPDAKAREIVTRIAKMLGKLAPVVQKIDFYKSSASNTTFDGHAWYTRSVTRYLSPDERANRQKSQLKPQANGN